jgi:hypothetical protein
MINNQYQWDVDMFQESFSLIIKPASAGKNISEGGMVMKKTAIVIFFVAAVMVLFFSSAAFGGGMPPYGVSTPLPEDLKLTPPAEGTTGIAKIQGRILAGNGSNTCHQALAVAFEEISVDGVSAVYSWGICGNENEGFLRVKGKLTGEKSLRLEWKGLKTERPVTVDITATDDENVFQEVYRLKNMYTSRPFPLKLLPLEQ